MFRLSGYTLNPKFLGLGFVELRVVRLIGVQASEIPGFGFLAVLVGS